MKIRKLYCMNLALFFIIIANGPCLQAEEKQPASITTVVGSEHAGHATETPPAVDHSGHGTDTLPDNVPQTAAIAQIHKMGLEMEAIKASADPEERKKLMHAHLASMTQTLSMLKDAESSSMMRSSMCPMMQHMQHGQEQGTKMNHGGAMAMGQGDMGLDHMAKCHEMMQVRTKLTNSLFEQLIAMQGQLLSNGKYNYNTAPEGGNTNLKGGSP
jgi:hypothetical protein